MWRIFPLSRSNIRLEGCLGYKNIVITLTKIDLVKKKKSPYSRISPVSQAQDVAHHGHDSQGAGVIGPSVKPHLETRIVVSERLRPSG